MNSASLSFVVSPKLIPPLYFLTFIVHSYSSAKAIAINIKVGIRIKVKIKVKVGVKGYIYILYSYVEGLPPACTSLRRAPHFFK